MGGGDWRGGGGGGGNYKVYFKSPLQELLAARGCALILPWGQGVVPSASARLDDLLSDSDSPHKPLLSDSRSL